MNLRAAPLFHGYAAVCTKSVLFANNAAHDDVSIFHGPCARPLRACAPCNTQYCQDCHATRDMYMFDFSFESVTDNWSNRETCSNSPHVDGVVGGLSLSPNRMPLTPTATQLVFCCFSETESVDRETCSPRRSGGCGWEHSVLPRREAGVALTNRLLVPRPQACYPYSTDSTLVPVCHVLHVPS